MPINLSKGQKVDLTKGNPGLTKIMVGLGWDVNAFDSGSAFDLDAAAFLLGASGKCPTERDFIFYGNLKHSTGAVEHMGDNLTGEGDGEEDGGSGENPLVVQIETEIVSAAPVQAGGGYTLHFSQYNGGRAEIRTAPDTEPVTGLFGKEPGKEQFEVLFGEEDYVCSPASYTDEEGERKIVLEVDLTEQYQALYPAAGITRAVRREYTSANAY